MSDPIKQTSWFKCQVEFENSFKFWFALMWQNTYIFLFVISFIASLIELSHYNTIVETIHENYKEDGTAGRWFSIMGCWVMPAIMIAVSYFGFYRYWVQEKAAAINKNNHE